MIKLYIQKELDQYFLAKQARKMVWPLSQSPENQRCFVISVSRSVRVNGACMHGG
ncbi:MAG: hypothetical protein HQK50_11540 [Oligoflexia bacterium]|nr:hypothetical protein [Oligoflexia bacterium]